MPYATVADLEAALGLPTLLDLTDRADPPSGEVGQAAVNAALAEADALVNSYLSKVARLPLPEVPPLVTALARDLAIHSLHSHLAEVPEGVRARQRDAVTLLKDIALGKASLGLATDAAPAGDGGKATVRRAAGGILSRGALGDYSRQ